jgi:hypothetical protein
MPDATMGKVPIVECVRSAWMFLVEHWRLFLPAAAIVAIVSQFGPIFAYLIAPAAIAPQSALQAGIGDFLVMAPAALIGVLFSAAILRKAVRNEFHGGIGLSFGADEVRLLGASLALLCLFVPLISLVALVLFITVFSKIATSEAALQTMLADPEAMNEAIIQALGENGAAALSLFIIFVFALFVLLATRLYMINAATIGEKRIVLFQTWSWSRGNILRMIAAMILTVLPVMLIDSVIVDLLRALVPPAAGVIPIFIVSAIASFIAAMTTIPVVVLGAIFYKGLRPPDFVAK